LKQAVLSDDKNPEYHYCLGVTYEKQGYNNNALKEYETAAKLDSADYRPYQKIAELNKKIGLRYDDSKYFKKSVEASKKAVELTKDPDSFYQQAAAYYSMNEFDSSIAVIYGAMDHCKSERDSSGLLMLLGANYVESGMFDSAFTAFENARSMISDIAKADMDDPKVLMTPELYEEFMDYGLYKKKRILKQFWGELDPDPTTQVNERRLEHYARFIYTQITFSLPDKSIEGSRSRRGDIYMRYGPPGIKYYDIGSGIEPPKWVWIYNQFGNPIRFVFEDTFLNGDFDFPFPNKYWTADDYIRDPSRIAAELADAVPQTFDYEAGSGPPGQDQIRHSQFPRMKITKLNVSHIYTHMISTCIFYRDSKHQ